MSKLVSRTGLTAIITALAFTAGATTVMAQSAYGPGNTEGGYSSGPSGSSGSPTQAGANYGNYFVAIGVGNGSGGFAAGKSSGGQTQQVGAGTGLLGNACTPSLGPDVPSDC